VNESRPVPSLPSITPFNRGGNNKEKKRCDVAHRKNRTDKDSVVFLKCLLVGGSKRGREFLFLVGLTVLQGLASKREATEHPHQTLSGSALLLTLFVVDQLFERARESGSGIIPRADFLFREIGRLRVGGKSWDIIGSNPGYSLQYFP
jgi:hypothetical protein